MEDLRHDSSLFVALCAILNGSFVSRRYPQATIQLVSMLDLAIEIRRRGVLHDHKRSGEKQSPSPIHLSKRRFSGADFSHQPGSGTERTSRALPASDLIATGVSEIRPIEWQSAGWRPKWTEGAALPAARDRQRAAAGIIMSAAK
jgi:hypothetical protein